MIPRLRKILAHIISVSVIVSILVSCSQTSSQSSGNTGKEQSTKSQVPDIREGLMDAEETAGIDKVVKVVLYENNKLSDAPEMNQVRDNKKIYYTADKQRVVNYADGYIVDLPKDLTPDYSLSPLKVKYSNDAMDLIITKEKSVYTDVKKYLDEYVNRYLKSEKYRKSNRITLNGDIVEKPYGDYKGEIISLTLNDMPADAKANYTYVTLYKVNDGVFYRFLFKSKNSVDIEPIISSFVKIREKGAAVYDVKYTPTIPENWTQETKDYYNYLKNSNKVDWGIFISHPTSSGINKTIPEMEAKIDYKFPVVSNYMHFGARFPIEYMNKCYEQGRMVQITYQFTTSNNTELDGYTPSLDIYRGEKDDVLRKLAQQIKKFPHPFLFRLNNEMNSDWTSYCGPANLYDPDIYVETWKRMYRIFQEEGVNNAIWIFNPNEGTHPPCKWNNFLNYMPPVEMVQLIGLTGYNSGGFYETNTWREFKDLYNGIQREFAPFFTEWPWVIPEFGCSSVGGDKAQWITDMFQALPNYPNIKMAIWFSSADYGADGQVTKPFWLDETTETLEAFKKGVQGMKR